MADPSPYVVSYSFSDFQSNSPNTPLPAPKVDNEFANIAAAVASLVAATKDIRRNDGQLNTGLVTFDSLALAVQLMLDPTNATLVANAVAAAQASATSASGSASTATAQAVIATAQAIAAAASAASVNLTLFLAKANNLAGLGSLVTSRANLGLGSVATFDVGAAPSNIIQLDGSAKLPAVDGSQLINIDTVPIGTTILINDTVAPVGFVKENGALLSRASFPRLWTFANASGNITTEATWGGGATGAFTTGDLATTFRVPDARGEFFRMLDDGRGIDAGRTGISHQADALASHTHATSGAGGTIAGTGSTTVATGPGAAIPLGAAALVIVPTGGTETRPRNNVKLACIKAY